MKELLSTETKLIKKERWNQIGRLGNKPRRMINLMNGKTPVQQINATI